MNKRINLSALATSLLFAILLCMTLTGCRTPSFNSAITPEQENTIGAWAAAQLQSESTGPIDPALTAQVTAITKRLNPCFRGIAPPHVMISDSDTYSVGSLPGRWVVISAKTIVLLHGQPDALASIIAHEYAHVESDDALKQMTDALGADTTVNLATQGKYTDTSNVAVQLMNFSHSIDDESRADVEGIRITDAAGYDPHGILTAIAILKAVTPTTDAQWLIVHPVTQKRSRALDNDLASYPRAIKY